MAIQIFKNGNIIFFYKHTFLFAYKIENISFLVLRLLFMAASVITSTFHTSKNVSAWSINRANLYTKKYGIYKRDFVCLQSDIYYMYIYVYILIYTYVLNTSFCVTIFGRIFLVTPTYTHNTYHRYTPQQIFAYQWNVTNLLILQISVFIFVFFLFCFCCVPNACFCSLLCLFVKLKVTKLKH